MANYFVNPAKAVWAASTAYSLDDIVCPTMDYATAAAKRYVYKCTTAGTSGGSEPTWQYTTPDVTTTPDNTATWTVINCDSWEEATKYASNLVQSGAFTSSDYIYLAPTAADQFTGNLTFTGPTSGSPVRIISSTVGSGTTVAYSATTNTQFNISGNFSIDGSFAFWGCGFRVDGQFQPNADKDEYNFFYECYFDLRLTTGINIYHNTSGGGHRYVKCYFQGVAASGGIYACIGGTTNTRTHLQDCTFNGFDGRTYYMVGGGSVYASGLHFTDLPAGTEVFTMSADAIASGIRRDTAGSTNHGAIFTGGGSDNVHAVNEIVNIGSSGAPWLSAWAIYGKIVTTNTTYYRTGSTTIDGTAFSWEVESGGDEYAYRASPWIWGELTSTGTKTFTIYVAGNSESLDNSKAWIEIEYLASADEANRSLASGHRVITDSAGSAYSTDSETWNGSPTYKQAISLSGVAVADTGLFRARICAGTLAGAIWVDPKVHVS